MSNGPACFLVSTRLFDCPDLVWRLLTFVLATDVISFASLWVCLSQLAQDPTSYSALFCFYSYKQTQIIPLFYLCRRTVGDKIFSQNEHLSVFMRTAHVCVGAPFGRCGTSIGSLPTFHSSTIKLKTKQANQNSRNIFRFLSWLLHWMPTTRIAKGEQLQGEEMLKPYRTSPSWPKGGCESQWQDKCGIGN